ncbi:unnamed protein product [Dovyalis caffra]|uniref:Uncharacterized protein n=1 Tax=Dovyalis caffra TaxID=77055 RepID=A0AAV1SUD4_9ROSI|nr:unnamed protein product [Dovyalis caffra]
MKRILFGPIRELSLAEFRDLIYQIQVSSVAIMSEIEAAELNKYVARFYKPRKNWFVYG